MNLLAELLRVQNKAELVAALIRPQMSLLPVSIYLSVLFVYGELSFKKGLLGWAVLLCAYGVAVILNDISDIEVDKSNKRKDTNLSTGKLTRRDANWALALTLVLGFICSGLIQQYGFWWFLGYIFLGWLYSGSPSIKSRGYLALVILAICYGVMPWLLGLIAAQNIPSMTMFLTMLASFFFVFGIISLKDFKDQIGDRKHEKLTVLVKYGQKFTRLHMLIFTLLAYLVILLINLFNSNGYLLAVGFVLTVVNLKILGSQKIITHPKYRGKYGNLLRFTFFAIAIATCVYQ